jgi:hypothetical protein
MLHKDAIMLINFLIFFTLSELCKSSNSTKKLFLILNFAPNTQTIEDFENKNFEKDEVSGTFQITMFYRGIFFYASHKIQLESN